MRQDLGRGTARRRLGHERPRLCLRHGHELLPRPLRPAHLASGFVPGHGLAVCWVRALGEPEVLALDGVIRHHQVQWLGRGHDLAVAAQEVEPLENRDTCRLDGFG